ncbi:hypothetical protein [Desulfonema magnum]|uniref:Uncharacterized protein n=1 Tax=Desulfonema magnum TaxID=45655 RepID=A0A975BZ52_9BACT|nr:hypothetical protein [Desulfonema magnum]QTA93708.1 Uncharacterized protein dnm_098120 [Desulfonema magnum]
MRLRKYIIVLFLSSVLMMGLADPLGAAGPKINIVVKTVLASQNAKFADPRLSDLIKELQSVFKYSSYRLLSQNNMTVGMKKTGRASLPENRVLKITPIGIRGNRTELRLELFKKNRQIFQTVIQLLNPGAITVGGPKYKGGYLLFNISNSF